MKWQKLNLIHKLKFAAQISQYEEEQKEKLLMKKAAIFNTRNVKKNIIHTLKINREYE